MAWATAVGARRVQAAAAPGGVQGRVFSLVGGLSLALRQPLPDGLAAARSGAVVAVIRAALLDLLATGDRACADAAISRFFARYEDARSTPTS